MPKTSSKIIFAVVEFMIFTIPLMTAVTFNINKTVVLVEKTYVRITSLSGVLYTLGNLTAAVAIIIAMSAIIYIYFIAMSNLIRFVAKTSIL